MANSKAGAQAPTSPDPEQAEEAVVFTDEQKSEIDARRAIISKVEAELRHLSQVRSLLISEYNLLLDYYRREGRDGR